MLFQICVFIEIVKLFYNENIWQSVHISVTSEFFYCFILPTVHITSELFYSLINSSLLLCRTCLLLFVLLIEFLPPNTGEVIMMLPTWPYSSNKKKLNHNKTRLKNVDSLLVLGLWCLMLPLIIFQLHRGGFIEETGVFGEHHKVTDKLYYIMLYTSTWSRFKL